MMIYIFRRVGKRRSLIHVGRRIVKADVYICWTRCNDGTLSKVVCSPNWKISLHVSRGRCPPLSPPKELLRAFFKEICREGDTVIALKPRQGIGSSKSVILKDTGEFLMSTYTAGCTYLCYPETFLKIIKTLKHLKKESYYGAGVGVLTSG